MTDALSASSATGRACHYCQSTTEELRPYGPGGKPICHPCMKTSPEREAAAESALGTLLDAAGAMTGVVAVGTENGPQPVTVDDLKEN